MSKQQVRQQLFEEFEYKEKAGTAWSHNYLNQKPWHPLSYPNQRRKWIAEQMHGMQDKRKHEVEKEFEKEQDFFKSSALLSKKQREKVEAMQSVSFLYTKPPGYNAESARAAEMADEQLKQGLALDAPGDGGTSGSGADGGEAAVAQADEEALILAKTGPMGGESSVAGVDSKKKRKAPVRDVFGRKVVTEEDFELLKNAPRVDTGIIGRAKPFGVELRNVRCGRCGAMGHQSGDRECPLVDAVTETDLKRQQREDPLSLILVANRDKDLTWEPKQALGGISPPRGGFRPDDPNQQILPPDDDDAPGEFDQYGGYIEAPEGDDREKGDSSRGLSLVSHAVLASLTKRQRKALRRALKEQRRAEKRRDKGKKKERKDKDRIAKRREGGSSPERSRRKMHVREAGSGSQEEAGPTRGTKRRRESPSPSLSSGSSGQSTPAGSGKGRVKSGHGGASESHLERDERGRDRGGRGSARCRSLSPAADHRGSPGRGKSGRDARDHRSKAGTRR